MTIDPQYFLNQYKDTPFHLKITSKINERTDLGLELIYNYFEDIF